MSMNPRAKLLRDLVRDGLYVVDEAAVAEAIVVRRAARRSLPDVSLRSATRPPGHRVRSFRPDPQARSFRLAAAPQRRAHWRGAASGTPA